MRSRLSSIESSPLRARIAEAGELAVGDYGAGPLLVALHGFTLTGAQFAPLATYLDRHVLAPDLPGHGDTRVTPVDLPTTIDAIAGWLTGLATPVPVVGYSMGGRVAMSLALDHPELELLLRMARSAERVGSSSAAVDVMPASSQSSRNRSTPTSRIRVAR